MSDVRQWIVRTVIEIVRSVIKRVSRDETRTRGRTFKDVQNIQRQIEAGARAMTQQERVEAFKAHGHDAFLHPKTGVIVIYWKNKFYRVVGGDFKHPTLAEMVRVSDVRQ